MRFQSHFQTSFPRKIFKRWQYLGFGLGFVHFFELRPSYMNHNMIHRYVTSIFLTKDCHQNFCRQHWWMRNWEFYKGALYSVNPSISCWLEDLFIVNERVSLYGEWVHGFFSYTAVGATMVGSIKVHIPVSNSTQPNPNLFRPQNFTKNRVKNDWFCFSYRGIRNWKQTNIISIIEAVSLPKEIFKKRFKREKKSESSI